MFVLQVIVKVDICEKHKCQSKCSGYCKLLLAFATLTLKMLRMLPLKKVFNKLLIKSSMAKDGMLQIFVKLKKMNFIVKTLQIRSSINK